MQRRGSVKLGGSFQIQGQLYEIAEGISVRYTNIAKDLIKYKRKMAMCLAADCVMGRRQHLVGVYLFFIFIPIGISCPRLWRTLWKLVRISGLLRIQPAVTGIPFEDLASRLMPLGSGPLFSS